MNAVIISVILMVILSLNKFHIVFSLIISSLVGGLIGHLSITQTIEAFSSGLGNSAEIALSYSLLGAFAAALVATKLPEVLVYQVTQKLTTKKRAAKFWFLLILILIAISSQNLIPIHIAFIPILIPTLLPIMTSLQLDRRAVACVMTFGLITPYMAIPAGFGLIYFNILSDNLTQNGLTIELSQISQAMTLPVIGMIVGVLIAVLISYRKPRYYNHTSLNSSEQLTRPVTNSRHLGLGLLSIILAVVAQILFGSMIFAALVGLMTLQVGRVISIESNTQIFDQGIKNMANIGFVMMSAAGLSEVLRQTGDIELLVSQSVSLLGDNQLIAVILMLAIGLFVTMGIGSSFSTIPILASLFVPLCQALGFSPLATIAIIGTSGALGDAGSPASDSTLGPTSGLNADGQHNHIYDTCVPTFIHFNIPLFIFGVIAALTL